MSGIEEIVGDVARVLSRHGYAIERIAYPESHERRSIDIVASHRERRPLLIKVTDDVANMRQSEFSELRDCSALLETAGLVVAERDHGEEIDDIVAHEKLGVYVVSVEGLGASLDNSIYVVKRQGNYYMRVDGQKLREERKRRGYGLGDLALMLSVSRRAVYMYEREEADISLQTALKLMEIMGEEVFKPIDILSEQGKTPKAQRRRQSGRLGPVASAIARFGGEIVETRRAPPDAVARIEREKMVIVLDSAREDVLYKKISESVKVAAPADARVVAILRRHSPSVVEADAPESVEVYRSVNEFINEIKPEDRER